MRTEAGTERFCGRVVKEEAEVYCRSNLRAQEEKIVKTLHKDMVAETHR